jgi:hypothetical protein
MALQLGSLATPHSQALEWQGDQALVRTFASYGDGAVADITGMTQVSTSHKWCE